MTRPSRDDSIDVTPAGAVCCIDEGRHRLLGRITRQGLLLYCRSCRSQRLVSWRAVDWFRCQLEIPEAERSSYQQVKSLDNRDRAR